MNIAPGIPDFNAPVADHARKDFPLLDADMAVGEALERIRREGVGERVIYFYAVDEQKRIPVRQNLLYLHYVHDHSRISVAAHPLGGAGTFPGKP